MNVVDATQIALSLLNKMEEETGVSLGFYEEYEETNEFFLFYYDAKGWLDENLFSERLAGNFPIKVLKKDGSAFIEYDI